MITVWLILLGGWLGWMRWSSWWLAGSRGPSRGGGCVSAWPVGRVGAQERVDPGRVCGRGLAGWDAAFAALRSARVISAGHAFVQNRRGHYELGLDVDPRHRLPGAFTKLALAI